jgi:hypothetical protein
MVVTNQLASVVNTLTSGDFYKNQGTLYLNSPQTGLYVGNSAILGGNVTISGPTGTILEIRNPTNIYNTLSVANLINGSLIRSDTIISSINVFTSTATVNTKLTVANSSVLSGNTRITGDFAVAGNTVISGNTSLSGTTRINDGMTLIGVLNATGSIIANGTIDLSGNLNLTGDSTLTGDITSTGNTAFYGKSAFSGNTVISGDITSTGNTAILGKTVVSGNTSLAGNTALSGNTSLAGNNTLSGSTLLTGSVNLVGNTALSGNNNLSGSTALTGNTILSGNTNLSGEVLSSGNTTISGNVIINGIISLSGTTISSGNTTILGRNILSGNTSLAGNTALSGNTTISGNITVYDTISIINNKGVSANGPIKSDTTVSGSVLVSDILRVNSNVVFDTTNVKIKSSDGLSYNVISSKDLSDANATIYRDLANTNASVVSTNTYVQNWANSTFLKFSGNPLTTALIPTLQVTSFTTKDLVVTGVFTNQGSTITDTNEYIFQANSGLPTSVSSQITVNRGESANTANVNAMIRWNNPSTQWEIRDVNSNTSYYKITTKNELDGANTFLTTLIGNKFTNAATFGSDLTVAGNLVVNGLTTTINTNTLSIDDKNITLGDVASYTSVTFTCSSGSPIIAVTSTAGLIPGMIITKTGGQATPPGGAATIVSVDSTTQITVNVNINTTSGTQFVGDIAGVSDLTANSGGITLKGTIDKTFNWANTTFSAWTSSENIALASGKSIILNGSSSGITTVQPSAIAGGVLTLSANTGTVISTGDTGTVTNAMLNGSITNNKFANSSITIGTTNIALGSSNTTLRGITNLTFANTINSGNTVSLIADNIGGNNIIIFPNQSGTVILSGATGAPITAAMIANNSIANNHIHDSAAIATYKLAANSVTLGTTKLNLGESSNSIQNIVNIKFANTINSGNTVSLIADNIGGNNIIIFPNQSGTVVLSGGGGGSSGASITAAMIANNSIANNHIHDNAAIATYKLAANSISGIYLGNNLNALANGTGLTWSTGTNYNGSAAATLAIDSTVVASKSGKLSQFASTTSSEFLGIISDKQGTGPLVANNSPTLTTPNIGVATGTSLSLSGDLSARNLTISGTTTTINSSTLSIDDKNITLGDAAGISNLTFICTAGSAVLTVASTAGMIPGMILTKDSGQAIPPAGATIVSINSDTQITISGTVNTSGGTQFVGHFDGYTDATADQGGITLKGTTDKTIIYSTAAVGGASAWRFSENIDLITGKSFNINNTLIANSTHLGALSGSSITNVTAKGLSANSDISTYREKVTDITISSGGATNIDVSVGNIFNITLSSGIASTVTLNLMYYNVGSGYTRPITLIIKQPATSPGKLVTVNGAKYTDGIAPILSTAANAMDVLTYWSIDNGTNWFGTFAMAGIII